jgi:hypothetical protein
MDVKPRVMPRISGNAREAGNDEAIAALREIEFDRATGKLAPADYDELKARYTERALVAMRQASADTRSLTADDLLEAEVAAFRARLKECVTCGPRPEPDAVYCSSCGTYLPGQCAACGAAVHETGATFCASCGHALAA